jgi:hypothetical protein
MNFRHKTWLQIQSLQELFVICWAGTQKYETKHLSRVDIELINEQIKLFYSDQDVVTITYDEILFIIEYLSLGLMTKQLLSLETNLFL